MPSTILVVDDEDDIRELLQYNHEKEGYRVVTARDGKQALITISSPPKAMDTITYSIPSNSPPGSSSVLARKISSNCEIIVTENGNSVELTVITSKGAKQKIKSGKNARPKKPVYIAGGSSKSSNVSSHLLSEFPELVPKVSRPGMKR